MAPTSRHPVSMHPLIGHEEVRRSLLRAFHSDVLPGALLLHGSRGIGKQHLALWLARLIVCKSPAEGPCDTCGPCRMALSLEHPDIHWYFPLERPKGVSSDRLGDALERQRYAELDELREGALKPSASGEMGGIYLSMIRRLRSAAAKRPTMAEGPVFIVGQAEMLVPQEASPEAAKRRPTPS